MKREQDNSCSTAPSPASLPSTRPPARRPGRPPNRAPVNAPPPGPVKPVVSRRSAAPRYPDASFEQTAPDPFIGTREIAELLAVSTTVVRRLATDPGFPATYEFAPRVLRWRRSEVLEWIESRRKDTRSLASGVPDWLRDGRRVGPRRRPSSGAA